MDKPIRDKKPHKHGAQKIEPRIKDFEIDFKIPEPTLKFVATDGREMLSLHGNGDILVNGKLIENDQQVVDGLKKFLTNHSYY